MPEPCLWRALQNTALSTPRLVIYLTKDDQKHRPFYRLIILIMLLAGISLASCQARRAGAAFPPEAHLLPTREAASTRAPSLTAEVTLKQPAAAASPARTPSPVSATYTPTPQIPEGYIYHPPGQVVVPILLYHNISDRGSTRYIVRPAQFRAQMKHLRGAGYQSITISHLAGVIRTGGYLPEKPVVITFDDGYLGVHQNALPILEEYGFQAVVYIISGTVATDRSYGYLQKAEIDDLDAAGWEIGSHSISHSSLKNTKLGLRSEIEQSKLDLEEKLGVEIRPFSYPYNIANESIRQQVEAYEYESAVGVDLFVTHSPERLYFLSRREVFRTTTMKEFGQLLVPGAYEVTPAPTLTAAR
jgi:peptidoglycan/xylan/chitin deacetylase (PgdA/CDA1 family)